MSKVGEQDCRREGAGKTTVYYVSDEVQQSQYINMFKEAGNGCSNPEA